MVTFLETESRMMVAGRGLEEEGNGKLTFNGCTVSILEDEKFWRWTMVMGAFSMWMYTMPLNRAFKHSYRGKFDVSYILLPQQKKWGREQWNG